MSAQRKTPIATIAASGHLSNAIPIGDGRLVSIQIPAAWDAASLTFQGSLDGSTFNDIYDDAGTEVTFAAAASRLISVDQFYGANWLKVRSGTSGTPVDQSSQRDLVLLIQKNPLP